MAQGPLFTDDPDINKVFVLKLTEKLAKTLGKYKKVLLRHDFKIIKHLDSIEKYKKEDDHYLLLEAVYATSERSDKDLGFSLLVGSMGFCLVLADICIVEYDYKLSDGIEKVESYITYAIDLLLCGRLFLQVTLGSGDLRAAEVIFESDGKYIVVGTHGFGYPIIKPNKDLQTEVLRNRVGDTLATSRNQNWFLEYWEDGAPKLFGREIGAIPAGPLKRNELIKIMDMFKDEKIIDKKGDNLWAKLYSRWEIWLVFALVIPVALKTNTLVGIPLSVFLTTVVAKPMVIKNKQNGDKVQKAIGAVFKAMLPRKLRGYLNSKKKNKTG